ncbi:MAG: right-handed parallel beta-helix repeat-containing protein [Chloroflexi bacterium]|nr:right-handed parallel beta-helix repeat-containing protein [Chloroflexota bacterium]
MIKSIRALFLSLTILAFLFSVIGTTTAYADDGVTTPEDQSSAPALDEEQPTDTEEPPPPSDEPPVETLLEQLPENTTLTILDSEGEAVPLASQESEEAIASGYDPIWCPAGQVPTPGENGCTQSFTSFSELLAYLKANEISYQQAGTIYIQQGDYLGGETEIDFNTYDFDTFDQYDLTLQGGWDTSYDPDVNGDPTFTSTNFNIPIIIGSSTNPWAGSLTLKNISVSGVSDQTGLTLYSEDNISLDEVTVTNSQAGAELHAGGDVKVEYSKFNHNKLGGANINAGGLVVVDYSEFRGNGNEYNDGYGLQIVSAGETNLYEVIASRNKMFGADITSGGSVYIDRSVFSGNAYSYEWTTTYGTGYGLKVVSSGNIIIEDIVANNNYFFGASLDGVNVSITRGAFSNNGNNPTADYPVGYGLKVVSDGTVNIASIKAKWNRLYGADIEAVGNVNIDTGFFSGNQGVTYNYNWVYDGYGLKITTDGDININGVKVVNNYLYGASLDGANVSISNSIFARNRSEGREDAVTYGLQVVGTGLVSLTSVKANRNELYGATITTAGPVSITNSFFNGNTSYVYTCGGEKQYFGYGLRVVTNSEVSLFNVQAKGNYLYGAHIEGKDVAIDTANFSNNSSKWGLDLTGRGLEVISRETVALVDVIADNNQLFGADIVAGDLVAIAQSSFNGHIAYYYDYFTGEILHRDGGYGLKVATLGDIAVEDITANGNYLYGANLNGDDISVENSLFTNNGSGVITDPTGYGLKVIGTGEVEFAGVNASDNQLFGADVKAEQAVTILSSFFSGHQTVTFAPCFGLTFYGYGLTVEAPDDIFLNGVQANYNNLWGAWLIGNNVTVYNSQFNNNVSDSNIFIDDTGLLVDAGGVVDIWRVEAKENRLIGATIKADGDVFIAESVFTGNRGFTCLLDWCPEGSIVYHGHGLDVTTPGLIMVTDTIASDNNLFGALLNGGQVIVANSTFSNNGMGNGLTINATDNVTLTNVVASNNGGHGVEVNGVCQKIVQVNGGTFADNLLYGLNVLYATLTADGTQVFANNGSGNIFTDTSICVVVTP